MRSTEYAYLPSWVGACQSLGCPGTYRINGGHVDYWISEALVTTSCLRLVGATNLRWDRDGFRDEYRTLFSARY